MAEYMRTSLSSELLEFMIKTLGKSPYEHYKDENAIAFSFATTNWFTHRVDIINFNAIVLTDIQFKYFIELHALGVTINQQYVLNCLNQEKG